MVRISVIIVNYNARYFLKNCLCSILSSDIAREIEIIVVDNDSKDGSCDMLDKDFPKIEYIKNSKNVGFGKANNQGVANAQYTFSPKYYMTAGTTSATTFSVYHSSFFGQNFNYNDVISSIANVTFIITEVLP